MERYYSNSGRPSIVTGYEIGTGYIIVRLTNGHSYKYSDTSCGASQVETMTACALEQSGLHAYIVQNEPAYDWKR